MRLFPFRHMKLLLLLQVGWLVHLCVYLRMSVYHDDTVVIVHLSFDGASHCQSTSTREHNGKVCLTLYTVCLCVFLWRDQCGLLIDL